MARIVTETFFLPDEVERYAWSVPAEIYNLYRSLLGRSAAAHVFVPIRSMQFLAVMSTEEIVFVDSQSYAVADNEGGRVIVIAWQFPQSHDRNALTEPVACDVVFYASNHGDIQLRLVADFRNALQHLDQSYRDGQMPEQGAKILKIHRRD